MDAELEWQKHKKTNCRVDKKQSLYLYLLLSVQNRLTKAQSNHLLQDIRHLLLWTLTEEEIQSLHPVKEYCPLFLQSFLDHCKIIGKKKQDTYTKQTNLFKDLVKDLCLLLPTSIPYTKKERIFQKLQPFLSSIYIHDLAKIQSYRLRFAIEKHDISHPHLQFLYYIPKPMTTGFQMHLTNTFFLCQTFHPTQCKRVCLYLLSLQLPLSPTLQLYIHFFLQTKDKLFAIPTTLLEHIAWSHRHPDYLESFLFETDIVTLRQLQQANEWILPSALLAVLIC